MDDKFKEMLKKNPSVDEDALKETIRIVNELKDAGVISESMYNLSSPYSSILYKSDSCDEDDPRTVSLSTALE